jgi:hypothetical protein
MRVAVMIAIDRRVVIALVILALALLIEVAKLPGGTQALPG